METVTAATLRGWTRERLDRAYEARLKRIQTIRDAAGGTLANVTGTDAEDEVRRLMAETNLIQARLDETRPQARARLDASREPDTSPLFPHDTVPARGRSSAGAASARGPWAGALDARYPEFASGGEPLAAIGTLEMPSILRPLVVEMGRRSLLEAIPVRPLDGPSYSFLRQTVRTNAAAPVATGARKPTSTLTFAMVTRDARTIATLTEPIPRDYLADFGNLRGWLERDLGFLVRDRIEREVIGGDGVAPNLEGILTTSGIGVVAKGADTVADALHKAITAVRVNASREPTHIVLHPTDAQILALAKTTTGEYLMSDPGEGDVPRAWGLPIVITTGITAGTGLVGDFAGSAELLEREGVRVDWSENVHDPEFDSGAGATDFERNMLRFRAEARIGLAVLRPAAFVKVTGIA